MDEQIRAKSKGKEVTKSLSFNTVGVEENNKAEETRSSVYRPKCHLCPEMHGLDQCKKFLDMSSKEKLKFVDRKQLCRNCLKINHEADSCNKNTFCGESGCMSKHFKSLHEAIVESGESGNVGEQNRRTGVTEERRSYTCLKDRYQHVSLPVCQVIIVNDDKVENALALLDSGNNTTYCDHALARQLGLMGCKKSLSGNTLIGKADQRSEEVNMNLRVGSRQKKIISLESVQAVEDFPDLRDLIPTKEMIDKWDHLRDIDVSGFENKEVRLIIGLNNPICLRPIEVKHAGDNDPYAVLTVLGWCVNGPLGEATGKTKAISNFLHCRDTQNTLDSQFERFWKVEDFENLNNDKKGLSVEDESVLKLWDENVMQKGKNYVLPIPFKSDPPDLKNNREMVVKRHENLKRKLLKNDELYKKYEREIATLIEEGYAEIIPTDEIHSFPGLTNYISIFDVKNPHKPEKFRLIHDCKAETSEGDSLNKQVKSGPDLTNSMIGILVRFREHKIGLMADIKSMFFQVHVKKEHCNALRFLWFDSADINKTIELRMLRHLFGGVWSPSAATYALRKTALDQMERYDTKVVQAVLDDMYVDNMQSGSETEEDAKIFQKKICSLLNEGGWQLTQWCSSSKEVMRSIPRDLHSKSMKNVSLDDNSLPLEYALGLVWDTESDIIKIRVNIMPTQTTKRGTLSSISSVFDVLGIVNPVIVVAKRLFQLVCKENCSWDESLPDGVKSRWLQWLKEISMLETYSIPRCYKANVMGKISSYEIHHFSGASEYAYGAVSYLRMVLEDGFMQVAFIMAKSRLCPMRGLTIPKAEMCGATISIKLDKFLRKELTVKIDQSYFWTDSSIVLHSIANENKRFKTFIADRLSEIHGGSHVSQWRHVPSGLNPTDGLSRGMSVGELMNSTIWKNGPNFLWQSKENWPQIVRVQMKCEEEELEVKLCVTQTSIAENNSTDSLLSYYSVWNKLLRAVAWVRKFIEWLRTRKTTSQQLKKGLTPQDMDEAETAVVKYIQKKTFCQRLR